MPTSSPPPIQSMLEDLLTESSAKIVVAYCAIVTLCLLFLIDAFVPDYAVGDSVLYVLLGLIAAGAGLELLSRSVK